MMSLRPNLILYFFLLLSGGFLHGAAAQTPLPDTHTLVRQSDFVGFVQAAPEISDPNGEWRQSLFISQVDPLKGRLAHDPSLNNPYPWIYADHSPSSGYPTGVSEKGEYLVFLHRGARKGQEVWTTNAVFRVEYRPDATGRIAGTISGDRQNRQRMSILTVRALLERVITNKSSAPDAARSLDLLFKNAVSSGKLASRLKPVSHEERLLEVQQLAESIKLGTTRAEIEKVFPLEDGGISGPNSTRYYLGAEVMVEVPYDQTGGAWKPQNRVNGLIKVYRSLMHFD